MHRTLSKKAQAGAAALAAAEAAIADRVKALAQVDADRDEVFARVARARQASAAWQRTHLSVRRRILAGFLDRGASSLEALRPDAPVRAPSGVVAVIGVVGATSALRDVVAVVCPPLMAGNAVVVSVPDTQAGPSVSSLQRWFDEALARAGAPAGLVQVQPSTAAADSVLGASGVDGVTFHGSIDAARQLLAAGGDALSPVVMSLGFPLPERGPFTDPSGREPLQRGLHRRLIGAVAWLRDYLEGKG